MSRLSFYMHRRLPHGAFEAPCKPTIRLTHASICLKIGSESRTAIMPPYETVRFPGFDILYISPKTFLFVINANVKLVDRIWIVSTKARMKYPLKNVVLFILSILNCNNNTSLTNCKENVPRLPSTLTDDCHSRNIWNNNITK